ncbi:hypothetical protein ACJ5NV_16335 [Loktanella agnita]
MRFLTVSTLSLISVLSPVTILADDASATEEMQMLATTSSWTNQSGRLQVSDLHSRHHSQQLILYQDIM